jgi:phosphatidylinositol-4,5-bisphosphate 3-kinase
VKDVIAVEAPIEPGSSHPIDPTLCISGYVSEKCKFMDSAKKPLWITYRLPPGDKTKAMMLKIGDDLTQDQLTLQILRVMDMIWKQNGLDMRVTLYEVLPTGDMEGYLAVVPGARTLESIGVTTTDQIKAWLEKENGGKIGAHVIENFYRSLAAYCVATYVLGIGDRHCSNMMMQADGHFFHIDFGHFLGHFKKVFVVRRENGMFYYSEALEKVLKCNPKSKAYHRFRDLCIQAFCCLRRESVLLISLLTAMLGTGIPELQTTKDVEYVAEKLMLGRDDELVALEWDRMLIETKNSIRQWASDWGHHIAHR